MPAYKVSIDLGYSWVIHGCLEATSQKQAIQLAIPTLEARFPTSKALTPFVIAVQAEETR